MFPFFFLLTTFSDLMTSNNRLWINSHCLSPLRTCLCLRGGTGPGLTRVVVSVLLIDAYLSQPWVHRQYPYFVSPSKFVHFPHLPTLLSGPVHVALEDVYTVGVTYVYRVEDRQALEMVQRMFLMTCNIMAAFILKMQFR